MVNDGYWWLYYTAAAGYPHQLVTAHPTKSTDPRAPSIWRSRLNAPGMLPEDWDSWGAPEWILGPDQANHTAAVAEPSLTEWGGISFGVVYDAILMNPGPTATDRWDIDLWFMDGTPPN